ncbi:MAG: hypothetical protein AAF329_05880 [Cyanobacteria bacterium P01_A01_bin.17]
MNRQMDLSELTTQQITDLLWVLKGTPQAQTLYEEYSSRPTKSCIAPKGLQAEFAKLQSL